MKSMYQCEKCGSLHEDYDKAWECETNHIVPTDTGVLRDYYKYKASEPWPEEVLLLGKTTTDEENNVDIFTSVGVYKLVKVLDTEKGPVQLLDEINNKTIEQELERRRWYEEYLANQKVEKEKAAQEASINED